MTFKNIAQSRKVGSLDGEVRAGSFNAKMDAVAMISWNPVQLCVLGRGGAAGKTYNITLDEATDVGLLSRDMAVVRTTTDVWQVLDLAHKPRVDPLGNDVQSLVGPQGEAALALRWDNSCDQYTPSKNEVLSRNFPLRGTHRAIDVGEAECYAVAGDGDGEFRIHPGATPEQGSIAKVALPSGTREFDRLRGSKFISAFYKRGGSDVCIIRRAGNRLEPKMLHLDQQIADIVVYETDFVCVAKDGRAILYDVDAIDKAAGSIVPKAELPLGCRGEPSAAIVARGNIFVGTSTGEIYMAVLVRKGVMM